MPSATDALAILEDAAASGVLDDLCHALEVDLLVVFGSAVEQADADRPPADLDVAVRLRPRGDLVEVVNRLIDLTGFAHIDVLDLHRASVVARARALGPHALPLYEAERGRFALLQMAALAEAMETARLRRLDLELLAQR